MGRYNGIASIIIAGVGINIPSMSATTYMAMMVTMGGVGRLVVNSIRPRMAPLKARIWLKVFAPARIRNIMPVMYMVAAKDFFTTFQLSRLEKATTMKQPTVPLAAASLGVVIPNKMTPMTRKTIITNGRI